MKYPQPKKGGGVLRYELDKQGRPVVDVYRLAQLIDRACFVLYILGFVVALVLVFPR